MSKKDAVFILGLTLLMGVIWVTGELVMGLWVAVLPKVHAYWTTGIIVLTVIISVVHSVMKDESDRTDPKIEKYERKVNKRKNKSE